MNNTDWLKALEYMCSKIGIEIKPTYTQRGYNYGTYAGYILGHSLTYIPDYYRLKASSFYSAGLFSAIESSINSNKFWCDFSFYYGDGYRTANLFVNTMKTFRVGELNCMVCNPFFRCNSLLDVASYEEALIQIDLLHPSCETSQIHEFVKRHD